MMRKPSTASGADDEELKETLAVLIPCTRRKNHPFPLTHIAMTKLGGFAALSDRVGFSPKDAQAVIVHPTFCQTSAYVL